MVNTDYLTKDNLLTEECDHYNLSENEYNGYVSDPSWIMVYNTSVDDSIFQYITSIPMRPSIECGGYGIVLFKFLVTDESGASSELSDVILEIIQNKIELFSDNSIKILHATAKGEVSWYDFAKKTSLNNNNSH